MALQEVMTAMDIDVEFSKYLASLGVGGSMAALLFFFYRRDVKQFTELWQASTKELLAVVREVISVMRENTLVLESLHRRVDRLEMLRLVPDADGPAPVVAIREAPPISRR